VTIISNSTLDLPIVNPNQLSHPTVRKVATQAFKRARSLAKTKAMKGAVVEEVMPGANVASDEDILQYIMESSYHLGTLLVPVVRPRNSQPVFGGLVDELVRLGIRQPVG
jgi:choline dehydrogenase-like flavoprotein